MTTGPCWITCRWSRWPDLHLASGPTGSPAKKSSCSARSDARCSGHGPSLTPGNPRRSSVRAWKSPDWTCWPCSAPWTAWIFLPMKSPRASLRQLFERDADYAEARWALDQVEGSLDRRAMLRDTLTALDQLPSACAQFRKQLPARAHPTLEQLEGSVRKALNPKEAYNMVPGRDPENVYAPPSGSGLVVTALVVQLQQIHAKVAVEIAPDGMDVVGVVLGVVVFDQKPRSLHPIVVRVALLNAAGPGEVDILARLLDLLFAAFRYLVRHVSRILFDERHQQFELLGIHLGSLQSGGLTLQRSLAAVERQDIFVRLRVDDRHLALLGIERLDHGAAEIFLGGQHAQSFTRAFSHLRGIGAEETRCPRHMAANHGVVLAEVVAFHAIAPGSVGRRHAEYGDEVFLGIALGAGAMLDDAQHVFQAHDRFRLEVALLAESRAKKRRGQMLLRGRHFPQCQTFSLDGDEVPVLALIFFEGEGGLSALLGCQGSQKAIGGLGHEGGDRKSVV